MDSSILNAGIELMFVGMGIVFLFLALLVLAVNLMSQSIQYYQPEEELGAVTNGNTDSGVIAAISAAIKQYRSKHR